MRSVMRSLLGFALLASLPALATADTNAAPYLRERGTGLRTSMFATYVRPKELLVYTFFEYYRDKNFQYSPSEFGHLDPQDYEGRYRASEGLVFMSYGLSDRLAIEMEAAVITATLRKAPNDLSTMPARVEESGVGDVEGQLTWRAVKENAHRPEVFAFVEAVIPRAKHKDLIGTPDWEGTIGAGASRGYGFGTVSARISLEYARVSETPWDLGEWGLEYIRRFPRSWLIYAGVEGQALDELALITEVQRVLTPHVTLKVGSGIGLTSNTTDFAPELGIVFSFPTGGK